MRGLRAVDSALVQRVGSRERSLARLPMPNAQHITIEGPTPHASGNAVVLDAKKLLIQIPGASVRIPATADPGQCGNVRVPMDDQLGPVW